MATYKVIQDIEAEDKFLGPLTLKQFVFGATGLVFAWLNFFAISRGFPYATIVFVPPMLLGFFLAFPWSKDQPTEIWLLAKLRFYFKPRVKIWDQSGIEELVTITAPKKEEKPLTKNYSQHEVKSRLEALAQTIDSRGWAVKDFAATASNPTVLNSADRLVGASSLPQEIPAIDLAAIPDLYTEDTATTVKLDQMIEQRTEERRQQNLDKMNRIRQGEPLEAVTAEPAFTPPPVEQPAVLMQAPTFDERTLTEQLKQRKAPDSIAKAHMRQLRPLSDAQEPAEATVQPPSYLHEPTPARVIDEGPPQPPQTQPVTTEPTPTPTSAAILEYAGNNDLSIETIARQAKKDQEDSNDEVVISLH